MEYNVHTFETEQEALDAVAVIDNHFGFTGNITQTYAITEEYNGVWFIYADETTVKFLGESEVINIETTEEE